MRRNLGLALAAVLAALAPAPSPRQDPPPPAQAPPPAPERPPSAAELAQARAEAGNRAAELAWLYYSENRVDADRVYRWSRRAWDAERDAANDAAGRVQAADKHRERMLRLEAKIARIRGLGFGSTLDVAEVEYYVREADVWLNQARLAANGKG